MIPLLIFINFGWKGENLEGGVKVYVLQDHQKHTLTHTEGALKKLG